MWMAAQIAFCVIMALLACFFIGKKLGARRFLKIQEEMKALEKAFNQLLEQMQLVSDHNLKVLEKQTNDLRELLHVADKKCLVANDLMQELETAGKAAKTDLSSIRDLSPYPRLSNDKEIKNLKDMIASSEARISDLESKLGKSDSRWKSLVKMLDMLHEAKSIPPEQKSAGITGKTIQPVMRDDKPFSTATKAETAIRSMKPDKYPLTQTHAASTPLKSDTGAKVAKKSDFVVDEKMPPPKPGTLFHEVLKLAHDGVTIPQIARKLKLGTGEIELIMNIYGSSFKIRKVM